MSRGDGTVLHVVERPLGYLLENVLLYHDPEALAQPAVDVEALRAAAEDLDVACETCHLEYWYPRQKELMPSMGKSVVLRSSAGVSALHH